MIMMLWVLGTALFSVAAGRWGADVGSTFLAAKGVTTANFRSEVIPTSFGGVMALLYLFGVLLVTFFLPEGYTIIPITQLTDSLGLLNTHLGVVLGLGAGGQVAATLLYAAYFRKIPKDLEEAARIDGAGPLTIFFRVMLPMAWPVTATVFILQFLYAWNAYLLPLVFTLSQPELRTLAVGMTAFVGEHDTDWAGMSAAAVISLTPVIVVFVILQRRFVDSLAGAVKQ